jgi:RNA ligase (TIGR02306 family)
MLEAAVIGEYRSVVVKNKFRAGDLVVYIPEGALVPQDVLETLNLWDAEKGRGRLDGSGGNRVKARVIRGLLSQGLVLSVDHRTNTIDLGNRVVHVFEGMNAADILNIQKHVPPIPESMSGDVCVPGISFPRFDIENYRRYPDALVVGEEVVVTEKLHGTCFMFGVVPGLNHEDLYCGDIVVASKGLMNTDLSFKTVYPQNAQNIYVNAMRTILNPLGMERLREIAGAEPLFVLGEIYGPGVQDFSYGMSVKQYSGFAAFRGHRGKGAWVDSDELDDILTNLGQKRTPVLYKGPWVPDKVLPLATGMTTMGGGKHIREGIVIVPAHERRDPRFGRVALKEINAAYLTRKNKDATEYS